MVFRIKRDAEGNALRYKARLVAQGYPQQPGIDYDEVFAPVVRYDSLRLLLALAAHHQWQVDQLDIKAAFLYGHINEEVYMCLPDLPPDSQSSASSSCAKLNKCIYSLNSPRVHGLLDWLAISHVRVSDLAISTHLPYIAAHYRDICG